MMPAVPKWIGDAMETVLSSKYTEVKVQSTENLNHCIRKICFKGDFMDLDCLPEYAVAFRTDERNSRNYTPSLFDQEKGIWEIIFYLREECPGSLFVRNLKTRDRLKMIVPRGRQLFRPDKKHHFFFGDETSPGLCLLLARTIKTLNLNYSDLMEMSSENYLVPRQLDLKVKPLIKTRDHKNLPGRLKEIKVRHPEFFSEGVFYLTGNAASIQAFRKELRLQEVDMKNIKAQACWAEGKKGL